MVNWKFGDEFDEWEGQKGMPDFLAVRGDHSVVPTEVTNWYSIKVRLELKETYDHQIPVLSEWKEKTTSSTTLDHPPRWENTVLYLP